MTEDQVHDLVIENIQLKLLRDHTAIDIKYAAQRKWIDIFFLALGAAGLGVMAFSVGHLIGVSKMQEEAVDRDFAVYEADMPNFKWKEDE